MMLFGFIDLQPQSELSGGFTHCLFVCFFVFCRPPETRVAAGARAGQPDHGCPGCFLPKISSPERNFTPPVKFIYTSLVAQNSS